jgi:hypothetical protein
MGTGRIQTSDHHCAAQIIAAHTRAAHADPLRHEIDPAGFAGSARFPGRNGTGPAAPKALGLAALTWCRLQEWNPRPTDYKSVALPAELNRRRRGWCGGERKKPHAELRGEILGGPQSGRPRGNDPKPEKDKEADCGTSSRLSLALTWAHSCSPTTRIMAV